MNVSGYSADELNCFRDVLSSAQSDVLAHDLNVSLPLMTKRLFDAASRGERDPHRLKAAVLGALG